MNVANVWEWDGWNGTNPWIGFKIQMRVGLRCRKMKQELGWGREPGLGTERCVAIPFSHIQKGIDAASRRTRDGKRGSTQTHPIYSCFRDTTAAKWGATCQPLLPLIGIWTEISPMKTYLLASAEIYLIIFLECSLVFLGV